MKHLLFSMLALVIFSQTAGAHDGSKCHSCETETIRVVREVR